MPGSASNFLENKLLDHALGTNTFTKPTTIYVGLYTVAPSDTASGTEVSGGPGAGYARQTITFSAASSGQALNSSNVTFANLPTCNIVAVGLFDNSNLANTTVFFYSTLASPRVLTAGDTIRINSGALTVSLD